MFPFWETLRGAPLNPRVFPPFGRVSEGQQSSSRRLPPVRSYIYSHDGCTIMGFGKDGKGQILYDITILSPGSLSPNDVGSTAVHTNLTEDFRILKTEYWVSWNPVITDGQEGPVIVGMAAGGLSATEIEECLEADPTDTSDAPESEQVMRAVWPLEQFILYNDTTGVDYGSVISAQGTFNPKWTMPNPSGWSWWVYNQSTALLTGGAFFFFAKHFGVWVR